MEGDIPVGEWNIKVMDGFDEILVSGEVSPYHHI